MGIPVAELLSRVSSHELAEWRAYEELHGLLGPRWEQEMLREIHLMLQVQHHTSVQLKMDKGKKNPVPEPKRLPGPNEFVKVDDDEEED